MAVMNTLEAGGHKAFLVGGCVRDTLLSRPPQDYDITTCAAPNRVSDLFPVTVPTGLRFGTVTVMTPGGPVEVTTMRRDGAYKDCRRPDHVVFSDDLRGDVQRRDFTINGLAMDSRGTVIDYVGGCGDLGQGTIRAIGSARDRFAEDGLRLMRAARLAAQLDFTIEGETAAAAKANAHLMAKVSAERKRDELVKILLSDRPAYGMLLLLNLGLLPNVLPELMPCVGFEQRSKYHDQDVFGHMVSVLANSPRKLNVRMAAVLHDIGKPSTFTMDESGEGHFYQHHREGADIVRRALTSLRFGNKTIDSVATLIYFHMFRYRRIKRSSVKRFITAVGKDNLQDLYALQIADTESRPMSDARNQTIALFRLVEEVLKGKEPLDRSDLAVNGHDLIEAGIPPGRKMGQILDRLTKIAVRHPMFNQRDILLGLAGKIAGEATLDGADPVRNI